MSDQSGDKREEGDEQRLLIEKLPFTAKVQYNTKIWLLAYICFRESALFLIINSKASLQNHAHSAGRLL